MRKETQRQHWTQEEVKTAIAKALENEPEGPNKDYWTTDFHRGPDQGEVPHDEVQAKPFDGDLGAAVLRREVRPCAGEQETGEGAGRLALSWS